MNIKSTGKSFFVKYKNMPAPVKASLWFVVCGFLQKGISMLTTPVFTRIMTTDEYGRYTVYLTWFNLIQIIASLNLAAGVYTRGLVKNEEDQDVFSSSMLGLSSLCILVTSLIYAIFHRGINDLLGLNTLLMIFMMIEIWATAAFQFWSARERVNYRYRKLVIITLLYVILRPLLGIITILNVEEHFQVEARVVSASLVNLFVFFFLYVTIARRGKRYFHKDYWKYALLFNLPLIPHYLSQIVLNQADRIMIDNICGKTETAYYSVAYAIASVLQILNTSIAGTMNPWIYKSIKNREEKRIGSVSYIILGLVALSNFIVVAIAPEFLQIMAPGNYKSAVWAIPPVTMSVYFMFLYNLFATFEYYFNKTKYVMYVTVVSAVLNVILNQICITRFGFVAAGYTTLFCYILCAVAHYYYMIKVNREFLDGERIYDSRIIVALGILLMVASTMMSLMYNMILLRYAVLILCFVFVFVRRQKLKNILGVLKER